MARNAKTTAIHTLQVIEHIVCFCFLFTRKRILVNITKRFSPPPYFYFRYKKLLALLFYLLDRGQRLESRAFERDQCCRAAGLYFVLLSLPGSGAFSIFHPVLFNRALDTFKLATKLRLAKFSPKKKKRGGGGGRRGGGSSQRARARHSSRAGSTCSGAIVGSNSFDFAAEFPNRFG